MLSRVFAVECVLIAVLFFVGPNGIRAQDGTYGEGFGVGVDVGSDVLIGEDFEEWDNGVILGGVVSYAWSTGVELAASASFVSHDAERAEVTFGTLTGILRRRFSVPAEGTPHIHPYVDARVGLIEAEADPGGRERGAQVGGGVGLELLLTRATSLVGGASVSYIDVGTTDGLRILPRIGAKVRF